MAYLAKLVTNQMLLRRWPSSRATTISAVSVPEVNFIQSLVDWIINLHSVCLQKQRLFLIFLFSGGRSPPLLINKVVEFAHSLLHKGIIGNELLWLYVKHVTHTKIIYKLRNLLVLLIYPEKKSVIRLSSKMQESLPSRSGLKVPSLSRGSSSTKISAQKSAMVYPGWLLSLRLFKKLSGPS